MEEQNERSGRRGNWVGVVIFLLLIIGPQLVRLLNNVAGNISASIPALNANVLIPALVALVVVVTAVVGVIRSFTSARRSRLPSPPTIEPRPPMQPPRPSALPTSRFDRSNGSDYDPAYMPTPPKFDPIIDPRILGFGIAGLVAFAIVFGALLAITGSP